MYSRVPIYVILIDTEVTMKATLYIKMFLRVCSISRSGTRRMSTELQYYFKETHEKVIRQYKSWYRHKINKSRVFQELLLSFFNYRRDWNL